MKDETLVEEFPEPNSLKKIHFKEMAEEERKNVMKCMSDNFDSQNNPEKGENPGIFSADYTQIPRGRIFQYIDRTFRLMCGNWINDHIIDLIKEEFNLQNVSFEVNIDGHWEIGYGWSEDYEL
jgi:hypothetical protein